MPLFSCRGSKDTLMWYIDKKWTLYRRIDRNLEITQRSNMKKSGAY